MPRGDKSSYTKRQQRMARDIEMGYRERGVSKDEAERRAWATVNKETHGGNKSGSGRGKAESHAPARKGGKASASRSVAARSRAAKKAAAARTPAQRSASAKKAAATRKRNARRAAR